MQMMVAVFDFPDKAASAPQPDHVPELAVDYVQGTREGVQAFEGRELA